MFTDQLLFDRPGGCLIEKLTQIALKGKEFEDCRTPVGQVDNLSYGGATQVPRTAVVR